MTLLLAPRPADAVVINTTFSASVTGLTNAAAVENAFNYAALQYENLLSDPITVNITVASTSQVFALGGSSSALEGYYNYSDIRNAFIADSKTSSDVTAQGNLPVADPSGGHLYVTTVAQMKAFGLAPVFTPPASDGTFTFGTNPTGAGNYPNNYTFDPAARAVANKIDFIAVAEHEISEIMGRISALGANFGDGGPDYIPFDLFHYTAPGVHSFTPVNGRYFSINNGTTNLKNFNFPNGNGSDPQDWAAGFTDAYNAFGGNFNEMDFITPVDVTAMDIVGYDPTNLVWKGTANSTWDIFNTANWANTNGIVKYTDSAQLLFDDSAPIARTAITLNQSVLATSVTFNSSVNNYSLSGTGTITGLGSFTKSGSSTLTVNIVNTYTGPTAVNGGGLLLNANLLNSSSVSVASGATLELGAGTGAILRTPSLSVVGSGKVNIQTNKIITATPVGTLVGSAYTGISGLIQSGRNGGGWTGNGIVTSQTSATTGNFTSIGVATAQQVKGLGSPGATAVWAGQTVTGSDTLVMYTYGGDANLDGKINVDDYGKIDFNIGLGASGWFNGDFNYDGKINVDDYGIIDFNVGIQGAPFPTAFGDGSTGVVPGGGGGIALPLTSSFQTGGRLGDGSGPVAVPEPAGFLLLSAGSAGFVGFSRKRR